MSNNFQSLKIGLDYHGVINNYPQYFRVFCQEALNRGHKIYILTGGPKHQIIRKLNADRIKYTAIFAIIDYFQARQQIACQKHGHFYIEKRLWNTAKARFCLQHHINIQVDDSNIYGKFFVTPYCLYDKAENICSLHHVQKISKIMFQSPIKALKKLETIYFAMSAKFPSASKSATY